MARKPYPTDVSDAEWAIIEPLIPPAKHGGAPRRVNLREVWNTVSYVLSSGCQWAAIPNDLAPKSTAHYYFRRWQEDGTLERINAALRGRVRRMANRNPQPSRAIIDAQSVKTTQVGGEKKRVRRRQKGKGKKAPHRG
jgi:putative transposase